ncbi:MAG: TonB-dependent receptor [Shewanella sp.]
MRRSQVPFHLLLCSILPTLPFSFAQADEKDQEYEIMVITASRSEMNSKVSPQVVTIITKDQIQEQLSISTDSSKALSNLLPAYSPARQKLSGNGETFRGRTALIMIDGVPQSNPLRPTGRSAHTIDLSMVEQIEVIHGSNAIHGLGATGGIINYITLRPETGSINQHLNIQTTSPTDKLNSDTLSYKLAYGISGNKGNIDYLFSASAESQGLYTDANGDAVGVDNTQGDLMDSKTYDVLAKIGYWIDENQMISFQVNSYIITSQMNYISVTGDRANGIATTSIKGTPVGDAPRNRALTINTNYENDDFYGMDLKILAYSQSFEGLFGATNSDTFQDIDIAPEGTLYDQSKAESNKLGLKVTLIKDDLMNNHLKLTYGFDILHDTTEQSLHLTDRVWVPESSFNNYAPFVQAEFRALDNLILHTGMRYEYAKLDVDNYTTLASNNSVTVEGGDPSFSETLYNFGMVYNPADSISLFANYSESFGMPDVGRVLRGIDEEGQDVDTFLNLSPIITDTKEVGIRYDIQDLRANLSYYESSSDFGTRLERIGDDYFLNRQETQIQGVEASLNYRISTLHSANLGYSHTNGKYDSNDDGNLDAKLDGLNIAPDKLALSWNGQWNEQLSSFIQLNYAFDKSFDDPEKEFHGYTTVDSSITYKLPEDQGKLNLSVENLLNEDYITYYSQSALVHDDRYFKGRGRTITLGYSVYF